MDEFENVIGVYELFLEVWVMIFLRVVVEMMILWYWVRLRVLSLEVFCMEIWVILCVVWVVLVVN